MLRGPAPQFADCPVLCPVRSLRLCFPARLGAGQGCREACVSLPSSECARTGFLIGKVAVPFLILQAPRTPHFKAVLPKVTAPQPLLDIIFSPKQLTNTPSSYNQAFSCL